MPGQARHDAGPLASLSSNQQPIRIIFEPHAREAPARIARNIYQLEGGVGVSNALGSDIGDAVAVRICGLRAGLPGQVRSHAVGCR